MIELMLDDVGWRDTAKPCVPHAVNGRRTAGIRAARAAWVIGVVDVSDDWMAIDHHHFVDGSGARRQQQGESKNQQVFHFGPFHFDGLLAHSTQSACVRRHCPATSIRSNSHSLTEFSEPVAGFGRGSHFVRQLAGGLCLIVG